ncbi:enoyl-CoA hydratase/isomerase family protein [Flaviflexus equikiangi]|uniref:enoyl-CoA hydratase/isomerase family protein n=1 Tax=Flaviflexus equikiangi TaxID=2758573 RepID=UPI0015F46C14|nr:enoyl-CoA hydratase/isomerase family protein [Flaviflexus equikiangi]
MNASDPRVTAFQDKDQFWITLDDPATKNALDMALVGALSAQIENAPPGVLVITGKNGGFSTGGGLSTVAALAEQAQSDVDGAADVVRRGGNVIEDLLFSPATTIALIDGACAGAGLGIALACDYRIATHRSRFTTAYAKLGLPSDFGTHELLRRQVGASIADDLMKTSDTIGVTKAAEYGLIDALIERVDRKGVKKILKQLPPADRSARMVSMSTILDDEAIQFARALSSPSTLMKIEKAQRKLSR